MTSPIRVLIFEDNKQLQESLVVLLNGTSGIEVVGQYSSCQDAKKLSYNLKPDVVLMDIDMPIVDGITGVRLVKETVPESRVIMFTVFDQTDRIFASLQNGADGYLLKATEPSQIINAIKDVFSGGAPMSPSIARKVLKFFLDKKLNKTTNEPTPKELEVLKHLVAGNSYKMIASNLEVSIETIRSHIKNIYKKLHVNSMSEAVALAIKRKLV